MGDGDEATVVYKTKAVQFLGRSTPIILQNDNGPCPLLAISNVLLLRNIIQLSPDTTEVPLQRLLSLVAERLLDSNSSAENQDIGYVQNQQQNISDAIDLLPRLATGIDVNVRFRHIHDFEFTRECAIFDLLDIGLVHGWIIDPQDEDTARVIGSKSYNTLMEELVALDASKTFESPGTDADDDAVDFAAATTATLGVPCPSLTRGKSFEESPTASLNENQEKSSVQEDEDLMKALDLSEIDLKEDTAITKCTDSDQRMVSEYLKCQPSADSVGHDVEDEKSGEFVKNLKSYSPTVQNSLPCSLVSQEWESVIQPLKDRNLIQNDIQNSENMLDSENPASSNKTDYLAQSNITSNSVAEKTSSEQPGSAEDHKNSESCTEEDATYEENTDNQFLFPHDSNSTIEIHTDSLPREESNYIDSDQHIENKPALEISVEHAAAECVGNDSILESNVSSKQLIRHTDEKRESPENTEEVCSSLADSEPLYEGEDCILSDHVSAMYENREPLYEGEVALAEQADNAEKQDDRLEKSDESCLQEQDETLHTTAREGMLIKTYLRSNASQLTVYGLFCLQEGLKERELCVFFRNNHFNTMFKFNGELYLLATDQGYINQPDLVWEKLNEVHGDTVFMTGDFKEFKVGESLDTTWNQHQAASKTADYIAAVSNLQQEEEINSDLQLAIALQKQEFDQQQPQPQPQQQQQPPSRSQQQHHQRNTPSLMTSRMVTGPDASRSSSSVTKQESKLKDKCAIM